VRPQIALISTDSLKDDPQTYAIIGAAMEVHRELGHGFLEAVHQAALALEFHERGVPREAEKALPVRYKGKLLAPGYRADFVCFDGQVIVETKAIAQLTKADHGQRINELKATGAHRGPLVNFGAPSLECQRLVFGPDPNLCPSAKSVDLTH
jgi:GxxExxY protein